MSIYTQMHDKYGNPYHVAEFRLFLLNDCFKTCENCFYQRSGNNLDNYDEIKKLAQEVRDQGYQLETCYLLPTDFFENENNYTLIAKTEVKDILKMFKYTGIAATLEGEPNFTPFVDLVHEIGIEQVELQINLINEKLFEENYFKEVKQNIERLRLLLGEKIVFNLALNLGREISDKEFKRIQFFVKELSDDGILEINFTFLYNGNIHKKVKDEKLISSLRSMKKLSKMYNKHESLYNDRTILRKPAFIFKGEKTYIAPIIPFDEYAFIDDKIFELENNDFDSFLKTLSEVEKINKPIINECYQCDLLSICMGKAYLATANVYNLPCFLGV